MDGLAGPEGMGAGPAEPAVATEVGAARLIAAVRAQLGLVLDANKAPLELPIVDHMDQTPTTNQ